VQPCTQQDENQHAPDQQQKPAYLAASFSLPSHNLLIKRG